MASGTASISGHATEASAAHYRRLSESGAGLIWVEYTYVHPSGRSEPNQMGLANEAHQESLKKVVREIKHSGAVAGIQLTHAGGKSDPQFAQGGLKSPSGVPVPNREGTFESSRPMVMEEIELWKSAFLQATRRAFAIGFDAVEYHSAHGYGLNQWLSPITNRRRDSYGGSLMNRMRLLAEIIEAARAEFPDKILAARIPGQDLFDGGLEIPEMAIVARRLEAMGLDLVDVSSGIGGWRRPPGRRGQGYLVGEAAMLQREIRIPVIGVGGIVEGTYIDKLLEEGTISLAAVGRAILENPKQWGEQHLHANLAQQVA